MLNMLKSFLGLDPPPFFGGGFFFEKNASHRGNVKNVKNLKAYPPKNASHWGNVKNVKKRWKVFWVLTPPPFLGGVKTQKTFNIFNILTFPNFKHIFVGMLGFVFFWGGVKTQKTFNIFNISPI